MISVRDIDHRSRNTAPEIFVEEFTERLPEGGKVLDVGCGTGYLSQLLSERGFEVVSVDSKEHRIEEGKREGRFQEVRVTTVEDAGFPDSSFDGIIAFEVLEHVEEAEEFLKELSRILKPEGTVAIKTPNRLTHDLYHIVLQHNLSLLWGSKLGFHPSVMLPRQLLNLMGITGFETDLLKPKLLPDNQKQKLGRFSKLLEPLNFRLLPRFLQPTLMAIGEKR